MDEGKGTRASGCARARMNVRTFGLLQMPRPARPFLRWPPSSPYVMPLALRWRRQLAALPLGFSQASEDGATTRSTGAYDALTKTHTRSTRSGFRVLTTHPPLPFFVRARCTCATGVVHEYTRGGFVRGRKISLRVDLWSLPPYIESQNHSTQQSARAGLLRFRLSDPFRPKAGWQV